MEANRSRRSGRGLLKGKLTPFYKSPKPNAPAATKARGPNHHSSPSPAPVGFLVHQDYAISQPPNPKVSIVVADSMGDVVTRLEEFYGVPADESVDAKAGIYISMVQKRLTLERVNDIEPNKFQEK